jgi:hypothetical protein
MATATTAQASDDGETTTTTAIFPGAVDPDDISSTTAGDDTTAITTTTVWTTTAAAAEMSQDHDSNNNNKVVEHPDSSLLLDNDLLVTLVAKFGKERVITLDNLNASTTTIGQVKQLLQFQTNILPKRQKLIGLLAVQGGARGVHDDLLLSGLKVKNNNTNAAAVITHQFILMGTPEEHIFVDPAERDDLPDVLDDFGLEFNAGSDEWCVIRPSVHAAVVIRCC